MEQDSSSSSEHHNNWIKIQDDLKKRVITEDDFPWELPSSSSSSTKEVLKYIGGVDISFSKEDPSIACGTLVVLELSSLTVVYDDFLVSKLQIPYVPGFLAFREVPILLKFIEKMKKDAHPFYPQLLMVDGNGLLHPRGFGLACHLGILSDLPTIGVGKNFTFCAVLISRKTRNHNWLSKLQSLSLLSRDFLELSELHHVEGLNCSEVRALIEAGDSAESIFLTGNSGRTLGVAARLAVGASKPIFISIGHRISLEMALKIVKMTSKNRVPEPIRQADIRSREYLRKNALVPPSP